MRSLAAVVAVGVGVVLALAGAPSAQAADGVELSGDGSLYGSALSAPLFPGSLLLIPHQSVTGEFWVRNGGADPAYLLIQVENPAWGSVEYGSALKVTASAPSTPGSWVTLATATDCSVVLHGVLLGPGDSVAVTTTITLGDLTGSSGQASWAAVDFGVTLTEAAGLPAPDDCSTPSTPVVVIPPTHTDEGSTPDGPDAPPVVPTKPGDSGGFIAVLANTLVSFDPSLIGIATASIPVGAGLFFLVGLIRRRFGQYDFDNYEQERES